MDPDELAAWLRLTLTPGVGNDAARRLLAAFGLPQAIFAQGSAALRQLVSPAQASALLQEPDGLAALLAATLHWLDSAEDGLPRRVITLGDALYPASLLAIEDPPVLLYATGQLQLLDLPDLEVAKNALAAHRSELLEMAATIDPVLSRFGGGPRDLVVREITSSPIGAFLVLHLIYDVRDAMGANAVNTALEKLAPRVAEISGGRVHLRILSNLADRRLARAECTIPLSALGFDAFSPETVRDGIIEAWAFAAADPYRAATHNKGIMNGIDAVLIATGNDWRAVEAGAHAYAAKDGRYTSLTRWEKDEQGNLKGSLEMPMAVGIIGGATRVHPAAQAALKLMKVKTASELAEIIVSVGLAQNLAALRALATEGIQRGHMSLHARQVALAAGAVGTEVDRLAEQLVKENAIRSDRALEILNQWRK